MDIGVSFGNVGWWFVWEGGEMGVASPGGGGWASRMIVGMLVLGSGVGVCLVMRLWFGMGGMVVGSMGLSGIGVVGGVGYVGAIVVVVLVFSLVIGVWIVWGWGRIGVGGGGLLWV